MAATDLLPRPIFLVGCPRSGTTLLRLVLDAHPRISCGPETHFLGDLARATSNRWSALASYGETRERWHGRVAQLFGGFHSDYARRRGRVRWADKTPGYVRHLDFVTTCFPDAQVVHVLRDGLDVTASQLKKWGWSAAARCAGGGWAEAIEHARRFRGTAPATRYHEIRYEDLVLNTEPVLRRLLEFLGEPWDEILLAYDRAPHDGNRGLHDRIADKGRGQAFYRTQIGVGKEAVDPLLKAIFAARSGRLARELGYAP